MMSNFGLRMAKLSPFKEKSEEKKPVPKQEQDLKYFRNRLSGIDEIMKPFENKASLLKSCDRVRNFGAKQRAKERLIRKECLAELMTVKQSLKNLEEEQTNRRSNQDPQSIEGT